jgi:serine/threonine-protein kinase
VKTDRFTRLKAILVKAVDLSGAERRQYLDEACKDDPELRNDAESILAHDADPLGILKTGGIMQAPGPGDDLAFTHRRPSDIPQQVARYHALRKLGEGGMGVVYEAEQRSPRRPVALKVVLGGNYIDEHRIKLFQREVQALARLRGADDGPPGAPR